MSLEHAPATPFLASALQAVKLRSAPRALQKETPEGSIAPCAASAELAAALETERAQNARLRAVDLESWYDAIADATFKTIFLPLAPSEARSITLEYHRKIAPAASAATDDACLLQLRARISDALAALGGDGERHWHLHHVTSCTTTGSILPSPPALPSLFCSIREALQPQPQGLTHLRAARICARL